MLPAKVRRLTRRFRILLRPSHFTSSLHTLLLCLKSGQSRWKSVPLSPLPYREVRRRLLAAGFVEVSRKGSHVKFTKERAGGVITAIDPHHREVAIGTLRSILRQARLSVDEFE